ncbi:PIN domain-containing protein [uncultured Imperialibacter sp.]|uniref:type II toxin-antitoxin system VapC family toxin n=1 Tax=uncultured Imperialibacter sp. TaxID=1672639 RepID=UPI0030DD2C88|tara:strand:- start:20681 stop:21103 length:423 start_codon:yes stop_codon:yes gene_type:complete
MILLDANILVASKQPSHPDHVSVTDTLIRLKAEGANLSICPQVIYEFYVVATRPADKRGFGLAPDVASKEINDLLSVYTLIPDKEDLFDNWKQLVAEHAVSGKNAHDTRIVAFMVSHGITRLFTMNSKDFVRFNSKITLI